MSYTFQRVVAILALAALSPLLICVSAAIRLVEGNPVLFRQKRIGRSTEPFTIVKFRTMVVNADDMLRAGAEGATRVTKTGRWLRRIGIDELPQLLNIARDEMAIVGPWALLPAVAANFPARFHSRYRVLPGITGLAQVRGRNELPWSLRLQYDVEYAESRSVATDIRILLRTLVVVFR